MTDEIVQPENGQSKQPTNPGGMKRRSRQAELTQAEWQALEVKAIDARPVSNGTRPRASGVCSLAGPAGR